MVLPATWRPVPSSTLVRLGDAYDGGYVLPRSALVQARHLVSMGLHDDWSFEADYLDETGGSVTCFDHTVDHEFWAELTLKHVLRRRWRHVADFWRYRAFFRRPDAEHRRMMVGYDHPGSTSLTTILGEHDDAVELGLKIDIEGWEYRLLDEIVAHRHRFAFLVVEWHDVDLMAPRISQFLAAMDDFAVVWTHANNFGGLDADGDPLVVEMAVVARRHLAPEPGDAGAAAALTTPNNPAEPDVELRYAAS